MIYHSIIKYYQEDGERSELSDPSSNLSGDPDKVLNPGPLGEDKVTLQS